MAHPIQAVIFDLGRVMVDLDPQRGLFPLLADRNARSPDTILEQVYDADLFRSFNTGALSPQAFYDAMTRQHGLSVDFETFVHAWCNIFTPMPGMEALFHAVAARVPVGILSDTDPLHWTHLARTYPYLRKAERPTLSFEVGVLKPDPAIYARAAAHVGCPAAACLFIDDRVINVDGARQAGMQSRRFQDAATLRRDLERLEVLPAPARSRETAS